MRIPIPNMVFIMKWGPYCGKIYVELEQLERLLSEDTRRHLMITTLLSHIGFQVKRRQCQSYKIKEFAKIFRFWNRADMILSTDGRTDGWADRRTNDVKPVNPSFQLRWSGGYNNQHRQEHSKCVKWSVFIWNCFLQPSHRSTACKSKLTLKPNVTTIAVTWALPQIPLPVPFRVDHYTVLAWWQSNC